MIKVVPFAELGKFQIDWLDSRFHFNFSGVAAPMGNRFGKLRVWNDDLIQPGTGFDMHGHRDMEIITYVRKGAISHEDSLGNKGVTQAGDVQVMTAGKGILHAEWNKESEETLIYQIWVETDRAGHKPGWDTAEFPKDSRAGQLLPLASGSPAVRGTNPGLLSINQDATLYAAFVRKGDTLQHSMPGRLAYLVPALGNMSVNGQLVEARGGAAIADETTITIKAETDGEILLMDVAA